MSRIIQPVVSPRGRVILLTGATLWLIAAMALSAVPDGAVAIPSNPAAVLTNGDATFIETIDGTDEMLYFPNVVTDPHGGMFVADRGTNRVIRVNDRLGATGFFGRKGAGPGEMQIPYGAAVDSQGNVFITDVSLGRLNKFKADGEFVRSVAIPSVAQVLVDANDELIVYPAPGEALMQRYSNDLEPGEGLLEDTDPNTHRTRMGIFMALDGAGNLFVLDQVDRYVTVYDRDMNPVDRWLVDGDELEESVERRLANLRQRNPDGAVRAPAFQSMALSPDGNHIAFAYQVRRSADEIFTRVVWYSRDGFQIGTEDRGVQVLASAFLLDGRLIESTVEGLLVFNRGLAAAPALRGNN